MVTRLAPAEDRPMTIEQPAAPRPLRRRGDDRVLGGVASGLADYIRQLVRRSRLHTTLRELYVERDSLANLAAEAEREWTGKHNPIPVDAATLLALYCRAF